MLLFYVGESGFAVDSESIIEVIPRVQIKPLLHTPPYVLGAISYEGAQLPIVDFSLLTIGKSSLDSMHTRIFILSQKNGPPVEKIGIWLKK